MTQYSILTVDLNNEVSNEKRTRFYNHLQKKKWIKINNLSTLWYAIWRGTPTAQEMMETTRDDIEGAAMHSGVSRYDVALANCGKPIVWSK
ncbi:MAG TPA: hypothetical protein P5077_00265 [bacterium]|nr:hypothetical protein [bacterium]